VSSGLTPFDNGEFAIVVTDHSTDGFRVQAPGLARALGFREAFDLLRTIPDEEKGSELVRTPGGDQRIGYVTEAGFYRCMGQRQAARIGDPAMRAQVERFQAWVYREVLPGLRRGSVNPAELTRADLARLVLEAEEEKEVLAAALKSAEPAIAYHDRFVANDDACTVKTWAAQFGLTQPQAFDLLVEKRVIYRHSIGQRWSGKAQKVVTEHEYRAHAGRQSFAWFDLRPQHNAPRHHNGQVRQTLYVRQGYALELAKLVGLGERPALDGAA
jgi:prophage antirepressor-like protein